MCGIVGYIGPQNPQDVIIGGLKKLEYRGYDSAGICVLHQGKLKRVRAEGKLSNLESKLLNEKFDGHLGIGHTRWATHGVPNERNAHPHSVRGVSLVHNGIIENYLEIREELLARGANIESDTDSELVAHLISEEVDKQKNLLKSVLSVLPRLRGAFSIVVMWENSPEELVAFKDGPPLIVGLGDKQNFIVSDVQAALQHTKQFVYLEDREVVHVKGSKVEFFSQSGSPLNKEPVTLNWDAEQTEKAGFSHFMLKEIYEQSKAVAAAVSPHLNLKKQKVQLDRVGFGSSLQNRESLDPEQDWQNTLSVFKQIEKVYLVACGTSHYAAMVGKYFLERMGHISVETDIASEFRYRNPALNSKTLVVVVSQSGETADTLAALRLAKEKSSVTLSICNVKNSSIDREASGHLFMNAGPEIGVASTKVFTCTLAVLNLLSLAFASAKGLLQDKVEKDHIEALQSIPSLIETVLSYDSYFAKAADALKEFRGFLYMGRGVSYPIALEGALKLKELAYLHAEGYAAGEMKHGPIALIDKSMAIITLAPEDELFEKTVSNLEEAKARGGRIISIGNGDNSRLKKLSERYLKIPKTHWSTNPILLVVPLQLMAFHLANSLGHDVDQPRNLAKSVTVE